MESKPPTGCTLRVTNIPRDMRLDTLRSDMESYGSIQRWITPPGPVHVYVTYETAEEADAARQGIRAHHCLVVDVACIYH